MQLHSTKKLLVMVVVLVLLVVGICFGAGEQESSSTEGIKKVTISHWGIQYSGFRGEWIEEQLQLYHSEHPTINVELTQVAFERYFEKLLSSFAGGVGPDVFEVPPNVLQTYYEQGILLDLDPYVSKEMLDDLVELPRQGASREGRLYGIPYEMEPIAIYYRKDLVRDAGINVMPTTWDELATTAQKLTKENQYGLGIYNEPGPHFLMYVLPFVWQGGGEIVDDPFYPKKATCDTTPADKGLQFLGDLYNKYNAAPLKQLEDPMINGQVAMRMSGIWMIGYYRSSSPDMDYGVAPLPKGPGGNASIAGGWTLAVNSASEFPDQSADHAIWLRGDPQKVLEWTLLEGVIPARKSIEDDYKNELTDVEMSRRGAFFEMLPYTRLEQPYSPEIVDAVIEMGQNVIFGGMSGTEAAKTGADAINRYLKNR